MNALSPPAFTAQHFDDAANDTPAQPIVQPLGFTGSGAEYFKIWAVNLMLTVLTLGAYSAWAKVRRLQYFHRNTHLAGAVFDFDGQPGTILRGRMIALVLLAAYAFGSEFSLAIGVAVAAMLLALMPAMLRSALRFRLLHSLYRGLRFDFGGSLPDAYRAYLPAVALFVIPAFWAGTENAYLLIVSVLMYGFWPLIHGVMKRYQHSHLQFGSVASSYQLGVGRLYRPYLAAFGITLAAIVLAMIAAAVIELGFKALADGSVLKKEAMIAVVIGALVVYLMYVLTIPYLQVRLRNLSWNATSFPGLTIRSTMSVRSFMKLQAINTVLTLLTLGLYRPFAAINTYAYQVAHTSIVTDAGLEAVVAAATSTQRDATGDGAADFFGIDISW